MKLEKIKEKILVRKGKYKEEKKKRKKEKASNERKILKPIKK